MLQIWNCLVTQHDGWVVLLAACICFLTSIAAANLLQSARAAGGLSRLLWLLATGLVTGGGVWATQFVLVLAFKPGFDIQQPLSLAIVSLAVVTILATCGFAVAIFAGRRRVGMAGGALLGLGISAMHFIGMASLQMPAAISWTTSLVSISVVLSVLFAAASVEIAQQSDSPLRTTWSAGLLMIGVLSQHVVAMGAMDLVQLPEVAVGVNLLAPLTMSPAVAASVAALVAAGLISALLDRRNRRLAGERNMQLDVALNNMAQGLCMFGPTGGLQLWNESYLLTYRIPRDQQLAGCRADALFDIRRQVGTTITNLLRHKLDLQDVLESRINSSLLTELEDGRTIRVTYRPISHGGWVETHEDMTERKQTEAQIVYLASHDPVTSLPNRVAFNAHLAETLRAAAEQHANFAVVRLNVDRFKDINDVFGQATGDAVLSALAQKLKQTCQFGYLARPGGDEFTIVTTSGSISHTADEICAQLSGILDHDLEIDGEIIRVGVTVGVSVYPQDGTDAETLIANADAALYRAKSEERGTIRFFEAAMDQEIREKRVLQRDLVAALERGEFELYFQPQATTDGEIFGFEILTRWHHPERGMVPPGIFIPIAEETGLIGAIDEWVLREACREAVTWDKPLAIAINLSPINFRRSDLPEMLMSVLLETGLKPDRLEIEITEGVLIEDVGRATSILRRIKNMGVHIALDDFGTGYSSLSYLQAFPFDKIKIDQSFIAKLEVNTQSAAIIQAILSLGRSLKLPVIAEGVETDKQLAFLTHEACNEVQGYLIGRPQPMAKYRHMVSVSGDTPKLIAATG